MSTPKRWKLGAAVRLEAAFKTHLGRLPADTPGTVLEQRRERVQIRTAAGDIWIDTDRLLSAQRSMEE